MKFADLPKKMQNDDVLPYFNIINKKHFSLLFKRLSDILFSLIFIVAFSWLFIIIGVLIVVDSGFPIIYKQSRITKHCKEFKVFKFRTMVKGADKIGSLVTVNNDSRITKIGKFLRKFRLDELPQIFNVLFGSMSLVGVRPEVQKYVDEYTPKMYATLLLPAGVTSYTSLLYKDEAELLKNSQDADKTYINEILPKKMEYNLEYIKNFSIFYDIKIVIKTIITIFRQ